MILQVPFEQFIQEVDMRLGVREVYAEKTTKGLVLTASDPRKNLIISSISTFSLEKTKEIIGQSNVQVRLGSWDNKLPEKGFSFDVPFWIAVVSYQSTEKKPGTWLDATSKKPSQAEVLKKIYHEFKTTGELGDIGFEEFIAAVNPNVTIHSSDELSRFLRNN